MKPLAEYMTLGCATILLVGAMLGSCNASCTPAGRQAFDKGMHAGEYACVVMAKCLGRSDIEKYCGISRELLGQIEGAIASTEGDDFCPLPEKDAAAE